MVQGGFKTLNVGEWTMDEIEKEREAWRRKAKEAAEKIVAPRAMDIDASGEFPLDIVKTFTQRGFLSLLIPREYGGGDADITSFCHIVEEIAFHCCSSALLVVVQNVGLMPIVLGGSNELKEKYLGRVVKEGALVCFCLTEPGAGSDSASIQTKAVLQDGHYVINGRKVFITNGGVADLYSVMAVTKPGKKTEGISAFLLEKGTPGLSIGKKEEKMGIRGSNTTEVIFEDVKVPVSQRIGVEDGAWWLMMRTLNRSRPAIAAQAVGVAQGALNYAIRFIQKHDGFTRQSDGEEIRLRIADMAIEIEAARALVYKSAAMMDAKTKGTPVQMFSAMAKYYASDMAMKITTDVVQMMQWHGLSKDHPFERMMRDAKVLQIYEGTNQIQRMVIAHTLLR
jgi:alkylation response protein AidB-like acyl-CoA dehydrogenase